MNAVITGVGAVSAFGLGVEALWNGLEAGRCAVGPIRSFDASTFPTRVAGEVPVRRTDAAWLSDALGPCSLFEAWQARGMLRDRRTSFALVAGREAWRQAGCGPSERDAWLVLAVGLEPAFLDDFLPLLDAEGRVDWSRAGAATAPPQTRFRAPVDQPSHCLGALLDLRGPFAVHVSACAASALAVAHAASLIERGAASLVVCGGVDSLLNPLGLGGMSRIGAPSPRDASDACRPFDRRRDGLAIGEGAAVFVLEDEARARARGARALGRVLGWGSTQDAHRPSAPLPDGSAAARAMRRALERAGLPPQAVDYVNAHGTGTPLNDPAEARAIRAVFGAHADHLPVSSIKGAVGHLMVASGAIEIASCLSVFSRGLLPGTANHLERDPECDIDVIGEAPRPARADVLLSNSFGFGGQNACLVLGRAA